MSGDFGGILGLMCGACALSMSELVIVILLYTRKIIGRVGTAINKCFGKRHDDKTVAMEKDGVLQTQQQNGGEMYENSTC